MGKKVNLSKEQIAQRIALQEKSKRFKKLAREGLYPVLQKHSTSLVHAQQVCEIFKTVIMSKMNQYWDGKNVVDLGLAEELTNDKKATDRELHAELIEVLADVPLGDAQQLLQGMVQTLDMYTRKGAMEIKLADVDVNEIVNND